MAKKMNEGINEKVNERVSKRIKGLKGSGDSVDKQVLLDEVIVLLFKHGFVVKQLKRTFDILASKEDKILLIKVLVDGDSINKECALQLLTLSSYLKAQPLIIALNKRQGSPLLDEVLYSRFGIPMINIETFKLLLLGRPIFLRSTNAGVIALVDGNKLRRKRQELRMSVQELCRKVGVTRRMIHKYELSNSQITLPRARRLYKLFGPDVFMSIQINTNQSASLKKGLGTNLSGNLSGNYAGEKREKRESIFTRKYKELGFEATDTKNLPFKVIAKHDENIILTEIGDTNKPRTTLLSKLLNVSNLLIFKKKKPRETRGVPTISKKEFLELERARELLELIRSYERE